MLLIRYATRGGPIVAVLAAMVSLATPAHAIAASPGTPAVQAAPAWQSGEYVGQDKCVSCHQDRGNDRSALHARTSDERTPAATQGCESCHGPGKAHVDGNGDITKIANIGKMSPQESSETCTTCHDRASHALWAGSQHDQRNVGCVTCHSAHSPKGKAQLKAASELELCSQCHRNITNKQFRFKHMPVREAKVECASCHNIHGSVNVKLLKTGTTVDDSCTSCHAEKRGPHLWEHAPVANSCVTCHDPHGSNNDQLLVARGPYLCQRCHVTSRHPPTVYDRFVLNNSQSANKIWGRNCVNCHMQIHGSNAPSGQMLLR